MSDPGKDGEEARRLADEVRALRARVAELEHRIIQYHLNEEAHRLVARATAMLVRYPRLASVARSLVRGVSRLLHRPAAPPPPGTARTLALTPLAGLRPVDPAIGVWEATDNDPQFLAEELLQYSGWIAVSLELDAAFSTQQPVIHFDYGGGWMAQGAIALQRPAPRDGRSETVGAIPANVQRARFDPTGHPGRFALKRFEVRGITAAEAGDRMRRALADAGREVPEGPEAVAEAYRALLAEVDTSYASWIRHYEAHPDHYPRLAAEPARWAATPRISLVVHARSPAGAEPVVASIKAQVYPHWELTSSLEKATGDLFAIVDEGCVLHPLALHYVAEAAASHPDAALVFTDEDRLDARGERHSPWFKCELNYELLLGHDMVSRLVCYRTRALRDAGGLREGFDGAESYDATLRVIETAGAASAVHVPRVLCHVRARGEPAAEASRRAVAEHLARSGSRAEAIAAPGGPPGTQRVRFAVPQPAPRVAIVIPTRDRADLLATCIDSILERSTYPDFRVIVVDNGSREAATQALFERLAGRGVGVIRDDSPFNFSALNNRGVAAATDAEFVCLMNNDIEVVTPEWLEEMVSMAARPGVGAVGARLWYPDGRLQHAGLIVGIAGLAGYPHKLLPRGEPGYFCRAILHQSFSAVTAACMVVRKAVYAQAGGLDERLPVAFNDLDFCLRLVEAGYRNVWTPYAELIHHESASRGSDHAPDKVLRLQKDIELIRSRWAARLFNDPAYSPNLTIDAEDFSLAWPPRL